MLFDATLYQVRPPSADRHPWQDLEPVVTIAQTGAFRPFNREACAIAG
ncbi:MAG: hypothetical protein P4L71_16135 [Acetobacteraceae bacterium]|nr:hypothetical protein [Acetobacteraceae bacterium]